MHNDGLAQQVLRYRFDESEKEMINRNK